MKTKSLLIFSLFFICKLVFAQNTEEIKWERFPNGCKDLYEKQQAFPLKQYDLYSGAISATKVSIQARDKVVCVTMSVATGKQQEGSSTFVVFENGLIICNQQSDQARLDAEDIKRVGYKIAGVSAQVFNNSLMLNNCQFFK
jgi:hypothetical protein